MQSHNRWRLLCVLAQYDSRKTRWTWARSAGALPRVRTWTFVKDKVAYWRWDATAAYFAVKLKKEKRKKEEKKVWGKCAVSRGQCSSRKKAWEKREQKNKLINEVLLNIWKLQIFLLIWSGGSGCCLLEHRPRCLSERNCQEGRKKCRYERQMT